MDIKELNEAIDRALYESKDDIFIPMLMEYFNVPSSAIRKATKEENWKSNMTYDDYYVKGNGFFEIAPRDVVIGSCVDRLEDLKDAAEASVIAKIFQEFIDNYGKEILINKKIEEVTEDNLEYVIDNIKFKKLSELLLSDDIDYVTDIGQWVNSYDGEIHFLGNHDGIDYYISRFDSDIYESVKQTKSTKKSIKEEMEYNRKIWDIFEENVAEYLNEHGVKPEGNNVMNYISKNAAEIVKAVLNKNYNYEEDDQAIFELYYNCPIHFTDKAQAIDKLLEEYLAESLKRCLTIEDKLLQISSLDKNESVTDKKSMKEAKTSNWKVIYHLEGDVKLDIQAEDENDSLKKAYDKLSKLSFRELDSVYDLNYKCIKNQKV